MKTEEGALSDAMRIADSGKELVAVMCDDALDMCFCAPYEEYASSMELSTYELLYVVHPDRQIE